VRQRRVDRPDERVRSKLHIGAAIGMPQKRAAIQLARVTHCTDSTAKGRPRMSAARSAVKALAISQPTLALRSVQKPTLNRASVLSLRGRPTASPRGALETRIGSC
jgi:hypothetical protein